uniref:Mammalian defensins domain-containing protein n=1 Tax=Molossus molossus TaxID=27622 RepID=A0A7J8GJC5_MOLMO|nr:hypothetical protein HJG59_003780 [Molossus molossus]
MRTLVLLAALLLVAFQARAQRLQETADQVPAWDQPEAEDQEKAGAEDQVMTMPLTGEEHQATGPQNGAHCYCSLAKRCRFPEASLGSCWTHGRKGRVCCR